MCTKEHLFWFTKISILIPNWLMWTEIKQINLMYKIMAWPNACNIIVEWCCDRGWKGWPNARNIFKATCRCLWAPGALEWTKRACPGATMYNVRVQHNATSKLCPKNLTVFKFDPTSSNMLQRVEHVVPNNVATCCVETLWAFGQALRFRDEQKRIVDVCPADVNSEGSCQANWNLD